MTPCLECMVEPKWSIMKCWDDNEFAVKMMKMMTAILQSYGDLWWRNAFGPCVRQLAPYSMVESHVVNIILQMATEE